ncbi:MAG: urease accessory protein UreD [Neomegalonema sp.]|nr:urease accessory protein UreD [Neomegalonema sp.]
MEGQGAANSHRAVGLQRAEGSASVIVRRAHNGVSRLWNLRHSGAAKCFLPKTHEPAPLAVLVNTAGGLAGGDQFSAAAEAEAGAALSVTTQAAERVYRAVDEAPAQILNRLTLGAGARLHWLPQETILFDGGRLRRRLEVEMAEDAELLALEMITLGRRAMGETVRDGFLSDQWRIRRAGELAFADALRLTAPIDAQLAPASTGDGGRAIATLLLAAPHAADLLKMARADLDAALSTTPKGLDLGASAWNNVLVIRAVAADPAPLRRLLAALVSTLRGAPPPKFWSL